MTLLVDRVVVPNSENLFPDSDLIPKNFQLISQVYSRYNGCPIIFLSF